MQYRRKGLTQAQAAAKAGIPPSTVDLVETRASQINGCAVCLDMHTRAAKKHGISDQQLNTLAAWRDSPYFDDSQRAALAMTEAGRFGKRRPRSITPSSTVESVTTSVRAE